MYSINTFPQSSVCTYQRDLHLQVCIKVPTSRTSHPILVSLQAQGNNSQPQPNNSQPQPNKSIRNLRQLKEQRSEQRLDEEQRSKIKDLQQYESDLNRYQNLGQLLRQVLNIDNINSKSRNAELEAYLMGFIDNNSSFVVRIVKKKNQSFKNIPVESYIEVGSDDQEALILEEVRARLAPTQNIVRKSKNRAFFKIRNKRILQSCSCVYLLRHLEHLKFQLVPFVCLCILLRSTNDKMHHQGLDYVNLANFLAQSRQAQVQFDSVKYKKFVDALSRMISLLQSDSCSLKQLVAVVDDFFTEKPEENDLDDSESIIPYSIQCNKQYLQSLMDSKMYVIPGQSVSRYYGKKLRIQMQMRFGAINWLPMVKQIQKQLGGNLNVYSDRTRSDYPYMLLSFYNRKAVQAVLQICVRDSTSSYPFIKKQHFVSLVSQILEQFDQKDKLNIAEQEQYSELIILERQLDAFNGAIEP